MTDPKSTPDARAADGADDDAGAFGWGVWSTGEIATQFARDLAHVPGAARVAVCSRSAETAEAFASAHGFASHYVDADAFLADPAIDAVYIASPHPLHCEQALAAIDAGKPVLIEKPIAMTAGQTRRIGDAASEAGVFAMEALWTRFLPAVQRARAMIGEGRFGTIERAAASLVFHRPFDAEHRLFSKALGGGALLDLGVYPISTAAFLFGAPVLEKASWLAAPTEVDIEAELSIRCGEVPVELRVGFVERAVEEADNHFVVFGTEGALRIDPPFLTGQSLTVWDRSLDTAPASGGWADRIARRLPLPGRERIDFSRPSQGLNFEAAAVQSAVRRGETGHAAMPISESAAVLSIIEQALAMPASGSRR